MLDIAQPEFRLVMGGEPAASKDRLADERLFSYIYTDIGPINNLYIYNTTRCVEGSTC